MEDGTKLALDRIQELAHIVSDLTFRLLDIQPDKDLPNTATYTCLLCQVSLHNQSTAGMIDNFHHDPECPAEKLGVFMAKIEADLKA